MKIDIFKTKTYDNIPVELEVILGQDTGKITTEGALKYRVQAQTSKAEAFKIYHQIPYITYNELRGMIDFS